MSNQSHAKLVEQLQLNAKIKNFDPKLIPTFGVFRPSQLQAIGYMQIRQQTFKQLIMKTLKICYLYDPIVKTLRQAQNIQITYHSNPNNLLKVGSILKILYENLFYRHMVKIKMESSDSVINLVNNRSTQLNRNVIIAALIVYISKRLSLEQIGTSLLIFNLEQALLKSRPYGLPLDQNLLQRCIKKIERIVNANDLKIFIQTAKQEGRQLNSSQRQDLKSNIKIHGGMNTNYITSWLETANCRAFLSPDQFLYLTALSQRKSLSSIVFFHSVSNQGQTQKKLGIDAFMKQKKAQYKSGLVDNIQSQQQNLVNSTAQIPQISAAGESSQTNFHGLHASCPVREKVRGLSLHSSQSPLIKNIESCDNIYKKIKQCILGTNLKKSSSNKNIEIENSAVDANNLIKISKSKSFADQMMNRKSNCKDNKNQKKKLIRPLSSHMFTSGLKIIQKNNKQSELIFNYLKQETNPKNNEQKSEINKENKIKKRSHSYFYQQNNQSNMGNLINPKQKQNQHQKQKQKNMGYVRNSVKGKKSMSNFIGENLEQKNQIILRQCYKIINIQNEQQAKKQNQLKMRIMDKNQIKQQKFQIKQPYILQQKTYKKPVGQIQTSSNSSPILIQINNAFRQFNMRRKQKQKQKQKQNNQSESNLFDWIQSSSQQQFHKSTNSNPIASLSPSPSPSPNLVISGKYHGQSSSKKMLLTGQVRHHQRNKTSVDFNMIIREKYGKNKHSGKNGKPPSIIKSNLKAFKNKNNGRLKLEINCVKSQIQQEPAQ